MNSTLTQPQMLLEWAQAYIEVLKWHVFLVWGFDRGKGCCNCGERQCTSPGKHPIGSVHPNGFKDATQSFHKLEGWTKRFPNCGLAIRTGEISNLYVFDIDGETGEKNIREYLPEIFDAPTPW